MQYDLLGHMHEIAVRIGEHADLPQLGTVAPAAAAFAKEWHFLSVIFFLSQKSFFFLQNLKIIQIILLIIIEAHLSLTLHTHTHMKSI